MTGIGGITTALAFSAAATSSSAFSSGLSSGSVPCFKWWALTQSALVIARKSQTWPGTPGRRQGMDWRLALVPLRSCWTKTLVGLALMRMEDALCLKLSQRSLMEGTRNWRLIVYVVVLLAETNCGYGWTDVVSLAETNLLLFHWQKWTVETCGLRGQACYCSLVLLDWTCQILWQYRDGE